MPGPRKGLRRPRRLRAPRALRQTRRLRAPRALRATRAGWCFLAIIFGVGFAALNTGNNLLYLVLAGMLGFLVLSGLLSEASLRGIRVERRVLGEIHAGRDQRVIVRIHNDQRRVAAFAVTVEDRFDAGGLLETAGRAFALRVGPRAGVDRSYLWCPSHRGDHRFVGLRVSTRFPFGLFVKSMEIDLPREVLVYPELLPLEEAAPTEPQGEADDAGPPRPASAGDELVGLRDLVPGDGLRRVQWRRSLRSGRLLVGEREDESAGEIEILLQLAPHATAETQERQIARAASEIVQHLDTGRRVGLRTAGRGPGHRAELLALLARLDVEATRAAERAARPDVASPHAAGSDARAATRATAGARAGGAR